MKNYTLTHELNKPFLLSQQQKKKPGQDNPVLEEGDPMVTGKEASVESVLTPQKASGLCGAGSYFWEMGTEAFSSLLTMCRGTERWAKAEGVWDRHNDPFRINCFRMALAADSHLLKGRNVSG